MKTRDFLKKHSACKDGAKWALSIGGDMADVWDAMIAEEKHTWLIWTATRPNVFTDAVLCRLACRFIRETPLAGGRMVWDLLTDERSRRAVEVAERYADGKANYEELQAACNAAYAAAYDATRDATRAAAYDAAYAAARATCAAAEAAVCAAARDADAAAYAANAAADDAAYAAKEAQMQMIAELGNPFKKERESNENERLFEET